jgi:hypothetical protein
MKTIKMRVITWIGLLVVCLLPTGARAGEHSQSGIMGLVDTNVFNTILVSDGRKLVTVPIDADGFFKVDLKPGRYVLTPLFVESIEPVWGPPRGAPIQVKVTGHHFTFVAITEPALSPGLTIQHDGPLLSIPGN